MGEGAWGRRLRSLILFEKSLTRSTFLVCKSISSERLEGLSYLAGREVQEGLKARNQAPEAIQVPKHLKCTGLGMNSVLETIPVIVDIICSTDYPPQQYAHQCRPPKSFSFATHKRPQPRSMLENQVRWSFQNASCAIRAIVQIVQSVNVQRYHPSRNKKSIAMNSASHLVARVTQTPLGKTETRPKLFARPCNYASSKLLQIHQSFNLYSSHRASAYPLKKN